MIIYPKLKFLPLQYIAKQKLPEILIYQKQYKLYESADIMVDEFIAFSLKKPSEYAKMKCIKSETARENNIKVPSVYVWFLRSNASGHGLGSTLLHIAKNYSEKSGCNGFFHLSAETSYAPERIPHIFYRKFGMSTAEEAMDCRLDEFIQKGKNATEDEFSTMDMFYPPIEHKHKQESKQKQGFLNKLIGLIRS